MNLYFQNVSKHELLLSQEIWLVYTVDFWSCISQPFTIILFVFMYSNKTHHFNKVKHKTIFNQNPHISLPTSHFRYSLLFVLMYIPLRPSLFYPFVIFLLMWLLCQNILKIIVRSWFLYFSISIYRKGIIRAMWITTFVFVSGQCCFNVKNVSSGKWNITVTDSDKYR